MSAPLYNQPQHGFHQQEEPPSQQGNLPLYTRNQRIGIVPTTTVIGREEQVQPNDYLAFSIIVMICCFLPLGIVALRKSQEVGTRLRSGDIDGALESSRAAHTYAKTGLYIGIVLHMTWAVCLVVVIIFVALSVASRPTYGSYYKT